MKRCQWAFTMTASAGSTASIGSAQYERMVAAAVRFLDSSRSPSNGSYSSFAGIGPTALATTALLRHGRSPDDPAVAASLGTILLTAWVARRRFGPEGQLWAAACVATTPLIVALGRRLGRD